MSAALCSLRVQPVFSVLPQTGRMAGRTAGDPAAAISPTQQMLASSTGALLTSIFGETKHKLASVPPPRWAEQLCVVSSHAAGRGEDPAAGPAGALLQRLVRFFLSGDAWLALQRLSLLPFALFQTLASSPLCLRSFSLHAGSVGRRPPAFQV